jgi:hypothetical protein
MLHGRVTPHSKGGGHRVVCLQISTGSCTHLFGDHVMKNGARKRILLVDDDNALLRTLTDYLVSEGFKELLPHMTGSVVASLVRIMPSTRSIPVVLYDETRMVDRRKLVRKEPEGVTQLLGPIDPRELLESVDKALSV